MNWKVGIGVVCLAIGLVGCEKEVARPDVQPKAEVDEAKVGAEDAPKEEAPEVTKIEGECVSDVKAHAIARLTKKLDGEMGAEEIKERLEVSDFDDIDRDGVPEKEAALFAYASNLEIVLYLSNSGCALPVGEFMASSLVALDEEKKPGELGRVRTWTKGGCAGLEGDFETFAFDEIEKKMKTVSSVSCSCEVAEGRPLECPTPE